MINRKEDCKVEVREKMRDGAGSVQLTHFAGSAELNDKGRLFAKITLQPGCGIGYHVHEKDSELFYILSGVAKYNDNGVDVTVSAGDVTVTPAGQGHSIHNDGTEVVELVAVIVYA